MHESVLRDLFNRDQRKNFTIWDAKDNEAIIGSQELRGIAIGGVHVQGGSIRGLAVSPIRTRTWDLRGVSVAGYNRIKGEQRGLTIGIYNYAKRLHGIQLGLINNARNNRGLLRVLPLVNVHLP